MIQSEKRVVDLEKLARLWGIPDSELRRIVYEVSGNNSELRKALDEDSSNCKAALTP